MIEPTTNQSRKLRYTAEGVAELREQWQAEYRDVALPPPPPEIFNSRQEAVDSCKQFAQRHGYKLTVGQSRKDNVSHCIALLGSYGLLTDAGWRDQSCTDALREWRHAA